MREAGEFSTFQPLPGFPHVGGTGYVGTMIPVHMMIEGGIDRLPVEGRRLDTAHPGLRRDAGAGQVGRYVRPCLSAVGGDLQVAVIGSYANDVCIQRRFGDRKDRRVVFRRCDVRTQSPAVFLLLLARIIGGQVRRDAFPASPLIF